MNQLQHDVIIKLICSIDKQMSIGIIIELIISEVIEVVSLGKINLKSVRTTNLTLISHSQAKYLYLSWYIYENRCWFFHLFGLPTRQISTWFLQNNTHFPEKVYT